jgi:hypothetical protein
MRPREGGLRQNPESGLLLLLLLDWGWDREVELRLAMLT